MTTKLELYEKTIDYVNERRDLSFNHDISNWNEKVEDVCVLLTASRGGSSLVKNTLTNSEDVCYMSGEESSYYALTKNGFPFTSGSDKFPFPINNKQLLLDCFLYDLGVKSNEVSKEKLIKDAENRLKLQFPYKSLDFNLDIDSEDYKLSFYDLFDKALDSYKRAFYDKYASNKKSFDWDFLIEDTPLIIPKEKRHITEKDLKEKTLLFKTPQNSYRIEIFNELFPNANIKYIHLSRGFAQTINGLMDGWKSSTGFFHRDVSLIGEELNIDGYNYNNWWCYEMPPDWKEYKDKKLSEVCFNQWLRNHQYIYSEIGNEPYRVRFEDFLRDTQQTVDNICSFLGIKSFKVENLPNIMITEEPEKRRWKKRESEMLEFSERAEPMMSELGYKMEPDTWI